MGKVLDQIKQEFIEATKVLRWPADKPQVRQSWVDAVAIDPEGVFKQYANCYESSVESFVCSVSEMGRGMTSVSYSDCRTAEANIDTAIKRYHHSKDSMNKHYYDICRILDVAQDPSMFKRVFPSVARASFIAKGVTHDSVNYMPNAPFMEESVFEKRKSGILDRGTHLILVGMGLENLIYHGVVAKVDLKTDILDCLSSALLAQDADPIKIEYGSAKGMMIDGDRPNLYRIFYNLARNSQYRGKATKMRVDASDCGSSVSLSVMDDGTGILNPEGLFEYQNKDAQGSGQGLFMLKQIIESHEGKIAAEAHHDDPVYKGACFKIVLPKRCPNPIFYPIDF